MNPSRMPFRNLLALVPEVEVLEGLRFALARHALADPMHAWSDVEDAGTIDVRVLDRDAILEAVREAAEEARKEVDDVYRAIGDALTTALSDGTASAAERLITAGAEREAAGRYVAALRFFRAAHDAALPFGDRSAQIVALRRMGRLYISTGELRDAEACYQRSADIARDADEPREEVIARTGLGNVYVRLGQWSEAERCYREALELCQRGPAEAMDKERAQLMNNLGQVAARQGDFEAASAYLEQADSSWRVIDSPYDRVVWHSVRAHINWERGDLDGARDQYSQAIQLDPPELSRALLAIDLANVYLELGDAGEARRWGRDAERSALSAGSVGFLVEVYRGLGNIARETGGEAVALYEKSLEIARKNDLRLAEALTLVDYAKLQRVTGNEEEARAFLEHSITILDGLGAAEDGRKARDELARIAGEDSPQPLAPA
jgi:tetratricopeptide (TPR) repeat protein